MEFLAVKVVTRLQPVPLAFFVVQVGISNKLVEPS